jgi:hypothetical protein
LKRFPIVLTGGESIAKFKTELRKQKDIRQVSKHHEIGPRKYCINTASMFCFFFKL